MPQISCNHCDWTGDQREITRPACPICQKPLSIPSRFPWEITSIAAAVPIAILLIVLALLPPEGRYYFSIALSHFGPNQMQYIKMEPVSVKRDDKNSTIHFVIDNQSALDLTEITISPRIFPTPQSTHEQPFLSGRSRNLMNNFHSEVGKKLPSLILNDLKSRSQLRATVTVPNLLPQHLLGWSGRVESFKLPSGYWFGQLERVMTYRLHGINEKIPAPLPQQNHRAALKENLEAAKERARQNQLILDQKMQAAPAEQPANQPFHPPVRGRLGVPVQPINAE